MLKKYILFLIMITILCSVASANTAYYYSGITFQNTPHNPHYGRVYDVVEEGTSYDVYSNDSDVSITKISFRLDKEAKNAGLTVYNAMSPPSFFPDTPQAGVYESDEVRYSGFVPFEVSSFTYYYRVSKGWLENNSILRSEVSLFMFDRVLEVWESLGGEIVGEDSDFVYYELSAKAAHYFYIGVSSESGLSEAVSSDGEVESSVENPSSESISDEDGALISAEPEIIVLDEPADVEVQAPSDSQVVEMETAPAGTTDTVADESTASGIFAIVAIVSVILLLVLLFVILGRSRMRSSVDRELHKYIKENIKRGKSPAEVKERLLGVGWHKDRVEKAMAKHESSSSKKSKVKR